MISAWSLLRESAGEWNKDNCLRLSAALTYYTVFSLAPLLLLATAIAGFVLGEEAVNGELTKQLTFLLGNEGAKAINDLVANARKPSSGVIATVISVAALLLGATGAFAELKAALNEIWAATPKKLSGVVAYLRDRLFSFAMVACVGFLLLVSLLVNAAISFMSNFSSGYLSIPPFVLQSVNVLVSLALTTGLFALIFKILPDKDVKWQDVWIGAILTSVLFTVGKLLIGLYLGGTSVLSAFGASASVILILVWTYYSSMILFFGAEFTEVYSRRRGSKQNRERKRAKELPLDCGQTVDVGPRPASVGRR